jgi:glutamate---cysteine ligase / carboxylate-amine ligase
VEAQAVLEGLIGWTEPARTELGLEVSLPERNGAQRQRQAFAEGRSIEEIYADAVEETRKTYVAKEVVG